MCEYVRILTITSSCKMNSRVLADVSSGRRENGAGISFHLTPRHRDDHQQTQAQTSHGHNPVNIVRYIIIRCLHSINFTISWVCIRELWYHIPEFPLVATFDTYPSCSSPLCACVASKSKHKTVHLFAWPLGIHGPQQPAVRMNSGTSGVVVRGHSVPMIACASSGTVSWGVISRLRRTNVLGTMSTKAELQRKAVSVLWLVNAISMECISESRVDESLPSRSLS